jgi:transposase
LLKQTQKNKRFLKKRRKLARDPRIDLWSLDECHFQQHGSRIRMWVPPEDIDPIQLLAPTRKSIALFGAVNIRRGRLLTQFEKKFNAMTFQSFLENLLKHGGSRGRLIVIILDNARYHHATLLKPFLQKYRKRLKLEFLPPYSPELNPIERVWKLTRRLCTHNEYFPNLTALQEAVSGRLSMWEKPNEVLRKLCCIN